MRSDIKKSGYHGGLRMCRVTDSGYCWILTIFTLSPEIDTNKVGRQVGINYKTHQIFHHNVSAWKILTT